jgi:hypothetical protein
MQFVSDGTLHSKIYELAKFIETASVKTKILFLQERGMFVLFKVGAYQYWEHLGNSVFGTASMPQHLHEQVLLDLYDWGGGGGRVWGPL